MTDDLDQMMDDTGGQVDDSGVGETDVDVEDVEIPEDLQAVGITEPEQYLELKKAGITDLKTLKLAQNIRAGALAEARDYYEKRPAPKPESEPEPPKVDTSVDYVEPLRKQLRETLGSQFRELEKQVKSGKLPKEEFFEAAVTQASEKLYDKLLGDSTAINQRLIQSEMSKLEGLVDNMKQAEFFERYPQYQPFAKSITRQHNAGYPMEEILPEFDAILAQRGGGNGQRRNPNTEEIKTAQLAKARVSVEGHTGNPQARGNPTSNQPTGKATLSKAIDEYAKAIQEARSGDPAAIAKRDRLAKRWQMARRG